MPLHSIEIEKLRQSCRTRIESLEIWLRRIIDEELTANYGANYLNHVDTNGSYLIKKEIREGIRSRFKSTYARPIDAAFFDDLISIITNSILFKDFFIGYFSSCFPVVMPSQHIYLRFSLERLKGIRNNLSHANALSIKDVEYTLWLSNELIESFKTHYTNKGKQMEYNIPQIIKVTDSFGNVAIRRNFAIHEQYDFSTNPRFFLRPGDVLSLTVEIDPSYVDAEVEYRFGGTPQDYSKSNKVVFEIRYHDVDPRKVIHCQIRSTKKWHKTFNLDDQIHLYYKVLPPIE